MHTHEGEPMKSFEVPILERDIEKVKSSVVFDPAKVQVRGRRRSKASRGTSWWSW